MNVDLRLYLLSQQKPDAYKRFRRVVRKSTHAFKMLQSEHGIYYADKAASIWFDEIDPCGIEYIDAKTLIMKGHP